MKRFVTLIILLLTGITGWSQDSKPAEIHDSYRKAIQLLQQSKNQLPADSLLFGNEYQRVLQAYKNISDSLKMHASSENYAGFETQRLINLCYVAQSVEELQEQQEQLFAHLAENHKKLSHPDSVYGEVAKCIVNSYELQSIWFEDTILQHVTTAMQQHLNSLNADSWKPERKQAFVNMYAAQYYKRGIVSMAEPVFRHFRRFYQYEKTSEEQLLLTENYSLYSADLKPTEKKIGQLIKGKSILLFVNEESPLHLIYLIQFMRTAPQAFPSTPVIVLWDGNAVSSNYMKALRRNLSKPKYYVAGLSDKDCKTAEKYASFTVQGEGGSLLYATNNPVDFQEWLEKPLEKQMQKQKEKLIKNYEKLQARKKRQENLPRDSSLKYTIQHGKLKVECRGYWDFKPDLKIKQYAFTQSSQEKLKPVKQMVKLQMFQEKNPIYTTMFISDGSPLEMTLTAGPKHDFSVKFRDNENRAWNRLSNKMDSVMQRKQLYTHLEENYPFPKSEFLREIQTHQHQTQKYIAKNIKNTRPSLRSLAELRNNIMKLHHAEPAEKIKLEDIRRFYPIKSFDSIIWRSPLYSTWLDMWLNYGAEDMPDAIDEVFGYWKVVPEEATEETGQYIWDRLNAMGRFDALVHLDTTWLAGCKGEENPDVRKRIEGYKRMAPGKKAPNISWESKGKTKDLYSLNADTVMVVFWSDDCKYCKEKLPELYHNYAESNHVEVIAVAVDEDDSSLKAGKKFMPDWHHVWAENGWEDALIEKYNVFGTPERYILDGDFKILGKSI